MKVLVVDDEPTILTTLSDALTDRGHQAVRARNLATGRQALQEGLFECLITDLRLPDGSGLELLDLARERNPDAALLVITAHQTIETAIEATRKGADYLIKPFLNEEVLARLEKIEEVRNLKREVARLKRQVTGVYRLDRIAGQSAPMRELFRIIETIAPSDATVLITGESGTGKELAAQAIHNQSPRADFPLLKFSCASLPDNLLEAELFGYERGAFTDAKERKIGRFERAQRGTIFLDDIDDMSLPTQVKLLRVIQERELERIGGTQTIKLNVRLIAATKTDLSLLVRQGRFRDDLYFRLNVVSLRLPPLRERRDDLPVLVGHFLQLHGGDREYEVDPGTLEAMAGYHWPGNVRELEHAVMRAIAMAGSSTRLERRYLLQLPEALTASGEHAAIPHLGGTLLSPPLPERAPALAPPATGTGPAAAAAAAAVAGLGAGGELRTLREVLLETERNHIRLALGRSGGNKTRAAQMLGISRKNLWEKMKELGLGGAESPS